jgi:hypothetical protein
MFLVTVLECFKTDAISRNYSRGDFEVFDDFPGENIGIMEIVGFFEAFVSATFPDPSTFPVTLEAADCKSLKTRCPPATSETPGSR